MTRVRPGVIVRASAGTGKTHRLAVRCIELAARGEPLDAILATTFTRKAAGEIRERVLSMLARAAEGDPNATESLRERIPGFDRDCARVLLAETVSRLHRVQIMTIDALAARMASMVQLEIGLPPGWSILDDLDDEAIRGRALERALERGGQAAMLPLLHDLHDGAMKASVHGAVMEFVRAGEAAWRAANGDPSVWDTVPQPAGELKEPDLALALDALARTPMTVVTKSGKPDSRWAKAHSAAIERAVAGEWGELLKGGPAAIAESGSYCSHEMPEDMRAAYLPVVRHAAAVVVRRHIGRSKALEALIARFVPEYDGMKREAGVVRFDDVPRALAHAADAGARSAMYFRLDTRFRHVLLDEFQDTSAEQFALVEPMVAEIVSGASDDRSTLIVGDPKQTLYSWRNAAPGLMDEVNHRWPEGFTREEMHLSRRSSPAVLEAVNRVFGALDAAPLIAESKAAQDMLRSFEPHAAFKDWLPGDVALREVGEPQPKTDDERDAPPKPWALAAADLVQEIAAEHPEWTIGVLTRKGRSAGTIISVLRGRGVYASAERGTALGDAPAVAAFAALLTLIDHPGHSIAAYLVAMSPVGRAVGIDSFRESPRSRHTIDTLRRHIADRGAADLGGHIMQQIAPALDDRGLRRFEQAVEMCQRFDSEPSLRLTALAERIWTTAVEDPSASRIRVMTVHAAKGLEFDAVVLPELGDTWAVRPGDVLMDQPDPLAPPRAISPYATDVVRRVSPEIAAIHTATAERRYVDELCALYVAMTRAKARLEMIVPDLTKTEREGKASSTVTSARVLRAVLAPELDVSGVLWQTHHAGDPKRAAEQAGESKAAPDLGHTALPPRFTIGRGDRPVWRTDRKSPSTVGRDQDTRTAPRRAGGPDGSMGARIGDLVHAWFERIGWIEDGLPEEALLAADARVRGIDQDIFTRMRDRFFRAANSDAFRAVLGRKEVSARFDGLELEVRPELPFMVRDDALLAGRFDRVMIGRAGGRVERIEIVDFKTDAPGEDHDAWLAERMDEHRAQMEAYRRAASALMRVPIDRVRIWLAFVGVPEVVEAMPGA